MVADGRQKRLFPNVQAPKKAAGDAEREAQRELMARKRAAGREVEIPAVENPDRRESCRYDPERFCLTYFGALFYLLFCSIHQDIVAHLKEAILNGGRVAIAAPRGFGKTTITLVMIVWAIVYGHAHYIVFIAKNGTEAAARLKILKRFFEEPGSDLALDFPEICEPAIALEGAPQRGKRQTVEGQLTRIEWGVTEITFPTVDGSEASGSIVAAYGLDEPIRGLLRYRDGQVIRPDLVLGDDPQTDESARSLHQTTNRILYLTKAVAPLAAPGHRLSIVLLVTVIEHEDLADQYTSNKQPSYRSIRTRAVLEMADDIRIYQEYIDRRKDAKKAGDFQARRAHAWYIRNRDRVEAGVVVAWEANYIPNEISGDARAAAEALVDDDLSWAMENAPAEIWKEEISAFQHQLNFIADADSETVDGWDAWRCEMQNDPRPPESAEIAHLDATTVLDKHVPIEKRIVPEETILVVEGWDVGRYELHWTAGAVLPGRRVFIPEYGLEHVDSPHGSTDRGTAEGAAVQKAISAAILSALRHLRDQHSAAPYMTPSGREVPAALTLIDCRYNLEAILRFCQESEGFSPIMGMGTSKGLRNWNIPRGIPVSDITRDGRLYQRLERGQVRYFAHSDAYKADVHGGFLLPWEAPGAIALFAPDQGAKTHLTYANHITAERETVVAKGLTQWQRTPGRRANHWLDTTYYCLAAVSVAEHWFPDAGLDAAGDDLVVDEETGEITVQPAPARPAPAAYVESEEMDF